MIITGYDRFDYAKDAISLGIFEYLLKPIQEIAFDEMIQRVRNELIKVSVKNTSQNYLNWAQKRLGEKRQSLVSELVYNIITENITKAQIQQECQFLEVKIPVSYSVLLIATDYQKAEDLHHTWTEDLIKFSLQNVAGEMFAKLGHELFCFDSSGRLIMIMENNDFNDLTKKQEEFVSFIRSNLPVKCFIISKNGTGIENISFIYHAANRSLQKYSECSDVMTAVLNMIDKNYKREDLSLQDVAAEVNLSIPYLSKLFRREMDTTFVDYLTNLRIRKAIEFLQDDSMKMYEIAENVGYTSQHYFSNVFKKKTGLSPNEYKRSMQNGNLVLNIAK